MNVNRIDGRITLAARDIGIPDLTVSAYDLDPEASIEQLARLDNGYGEDFWEQLQANRLGSAATDLDGRFQIEYDDSAFRVSGDELRPDLVLVVTGPEVAGVEPCPSVLYVTCTIRKNAARVETYRIQLKSEWLQHVGIPIPASPADTTALPETVLQEISAASNLDLSISTGVTEMAKTRVERKRELKTTFNETIKSNLINMLSKIPASLRDDGRLVEPGEPVEPKSLENVKRGIKEVVNTLAPGTRPPVRGHLIMTEAMRTRLQSFEENGNFVDVPASAIEPILFGGQGQPGSAILLRKNPLLDFCRPRTEEEECAERVLDLVAGEQARGERGRGSILLGAGTEPAEKDDIPKYVAKAVNGFVSAEEPILFADTQGKKRADQDAVHDVISGLSLRRGPAEVPALYDFYNLQIAFEHIWQEAIDQNVLDLAEDAYTQIVEAGGTIDPFNVIPGAVVDPVHVFTAEFNLALEAHQTQPPPIVIKMFEIREEQWVALNPDQRNELKKVAEQLDTSLKVLVHLQASILQVLQEERVKISEIKRLERQLETRRQIIQHIRAMGNRILSYADQQTAAGQTDFGKLHTILGELRKRLSQTNYAFKIYAADSVNFGVYLHYRQKWDFTTCQAGPLINTIPLGPKETRKYSHKTVRKKKRSEREVEKSLKSRKEESEEQSRAETEIVRQALSKTNFSLTANGSVSLEVATIGGSQAFSTEASKTSNDVKKAMHQAVQKSAEEYKAERETVVTAEAEEEFTEEVSGEITNPNDELAVTFLFYELQRRFRVSEHLHSITPVVLVAQAVPSPHEIDEDWILTHDWILRRVILDDSFVPALEYICTRVVGDEVALHELKRNVEQQRRLVSDLKEELIEVRQQAAQRYAALQRSIQRRASEVGGSGGGLLGGITDIIPGGGLLDKATDFLFAGDNDEAEAALVREEAARDAYERQDREERDLMGRVDRQVSALNALTETYAKALSEHLNHRTQIERLLVHIKENILYYMQAIWSHEPTHQRLFRLHEVKVPVLKAKSRSYTVSGTPTFAPALARPELAAPVHGFEVTTEIDPNFETKPLIEVSDLDRPLGFAGNYMIFPLKESNALTDFMMAPYRDAEAGLHDPDLFGNWSLQDFAHYVCCLEERLPADEFAKLKERLREQYEQLVNAQIDSQEIVVPTGSLFIEALPSQHPILEDFKLIHRAIDVKKVQEEVRKAQLENIRLAARLLHDQFEDPDIERKIVIEGTGNVVVPPGDQ